MLDELFVHHRLIVVAGLTLKHEGVKFVLKVPVERSTLVANFADGANHDKAPLAVAAHQVLSRWLDKGVIG